MNKLCKCGYDVNHPKITHKCEYSKLGWFLFTILGMSAKPKLVKFYCTECGETIGSSTEPNVLEKYIGR